jgi:hypothetical protein
VSINGPRPAPPTGVLIASVVAIPLIAITFAGHIGSFTSGSSHPGLAVGALFLGFLSALTVATFTRAAAVSIHRLLSYVATEIDNVFTAAHHMVIDPGRQNPVLAFVPADVGRRGPPRQ